MAPVKLGYKSLDMSVYCEWNWNWNKSDIQQEDKSSDIEQQPPFGDRNYSNTLPQKKGIQNQREHHIILTKYETLHPTYVQVFVDI